ncbi:Tuberous sclerosis 2-like protein, partial [Coemansia sp. RSA 1824]
GGRASDTRRSSEQSSKGASSFAMLFRNVLRSPFGSDSRNSGTARRELSPSMGSASLAAATHTQSPGIGHSPASIGEGTRLQANSVPGSESADHGSSTFSETQSIDRLAPVDSVALAEGHTGLADQDAAIGDRLDALGVLVSELKGQPLTNLGGLWCMLEGIVKFAFGNSSGVNKPSELDLAHHQRARRLILSLLAVFAEGGQADGEQAETSHIDAEDVQKMRASILWVIGSACSWEEVELAVQSAAWASSDAKHLSGDTVQWFERARSWVELAVDHCYPENMTREPSEGPPPGPHEALTESLAFLACIISTDYPVLDPTAVSEIVSSLCEMTARARLVSENGLEEVAWIWTEPVHLYGVINLLNTVITYGALSQNALLPGITMLCTTANVPLCKELCCDIIYTMFTSCYMRDALLTMNYVMRRGNTGLNSKSIYKMPAMTPYQAAVNGMVYYITQIMDTGPTGFQFSLRTGNCLPVLGEAALGMHPEVLSMVFPYLCKVANDDRVDSMLPDDWTVLIAILENTVECRLSDKYEVEPGSEIDEEDEPPTLAYLYDGALQAIVSVFRRSSQPTPTSLVNLLFKMRNVLSDELAQSMLQFIDARGSLRPGSSNWLESLEEMMHLYYFDRSRSTLLRRQMARLCTRPFTEAFDVSLKGIERKPFIIAVLEQLHLEEDEKIIDSVLEILYMSLRWTKDSKTFHNILEFALRAAIEPEYVRQIQPDYMYQDDNGDMVLPEQLSLNMQMPTHPILLLGGESAAMVDEKSYSSWARITLTINCLLKVVEWRMSSNDTLGDETYDHLSVDTISLVNGLLDLLVSKHTFPSAQRNILLGFLRFHADANMRVYMLLPDHDTLLEQRVSLHENARMRLVVQSDDAVVNNTVDWVPFPIARYIRVLVYLFQTNIDIETYNVLCRGLMVQLTNTHLFSTCKEEVTAFLRYLINYMRVANYDQETRTRISSVEKNRTATYTYGLQVSFMHYKGWIKRDQQDLLISTLGDGLMMTSGAPEAPQICLHALGVAMLELHGAMVRMLPSILQNLVRIYSAAQLSVHLLEFVSSISRNQGLYTNFRKGDYQVLFAVAINYIRFHNNQRRRETSLSTNTAGARPADVGEKSDPRRQSTGAIPASPSEKQLLNDVALSQYVLVMAYQVIDVYFLSLTPALKAEMFDSIIVGLLQSNYSRSNLDEVNEVCLDMVLQNHSRSSEDILGLSDVTVQEDFGPVVERHWIQHNGIVTIRAQKEGLMAQIIERSCSGATSRIVDLPAEVSRKYVERAERTERPPTSLPASPLSDSPVSAFGSMSQSASRGRSIGRNRRLHSMAPGLPSLHHEPDMLPHDSIARLLRGELLSQSDLSRAPRFPMRFGAAPCLALEFINAYQGLQNLDVPVMLPPNFEAVARSLRIFDNTAMVDTHKVSVAYVGPGQTTEREILLNQQGSPAYWNFLRGMGHIRRLGQMKDFSAGLDTSGQDSDGRYTLGWRDLIAKLIFHVGTLMPAREDKQEQIVRKKAHMGNDFVHIVFNESGRDYEFDTIPSQFNFVQIIVTPVDGQVPTPEDEALWLRSDLSKVNARMDQLYKVKTQINPDIPFVGPAAEPKVLTLTALPGFVRSVAIHAVVFSQVYTSCKSAGIGGAEYVSLWRARLQIIKRVRAHAQKERTKRLNALGSQPGSLSESSADMAEFGEPISDPTMATTAAQALGYLVRDLESFV